MSASIRDKNRRVLFLAESCLLSVGISFYKLSVFLQNAPSLDQDSVMTQMRYFTAELYHFQSVRFKARFPYRRTATWGLCVGVPTAIGAHKKNTANCTATFTGSRTALVSPTNTEMNTLV